MLWRRVQVERPRASTSGGQSEGMERGVEVEVDAVAVVEGEGERGELGEEDEGELVSVSFCLARASQAETEVQERQLGKEGWVSLDFRLKSMEVQDSGIRRSECLPQYPTVNVRATHGFPSFPSTTPLGSCFGVVSSLFTADSAVLAEV